MEQRSWFRFFRRTKQPIAAHLQTGLWGEREAERFLVRKGVKILGRRVCVGRHDELDLIARDGEQLLFIEVKTRASETYGRPLSAVNRRKQRALARAAFAYMAKLREKPAYFRFDVVEVIGREGRGTPTIRHIERAFLTPVARRVPW